eukprot:4994824-Alexandrium_andersonii.AAC.1
MVKATATPNNPFPARRASGRCQCLSICSLERRPLNIDTAAGAQTAQIVCGKAPWVSVFATPET